MFLETKTLAAPIVPPQPRTQERALRSAIEKLGELPPPEKLCFVLNAIISQHGCLALTVTHRKHCRINAYTARTGTLFNTKTAFQAASGKWVLDVGGTLFYPLLTEKFVGWAEDNFRLLLEDTSAAVDQVPTSIEFSRTT